VSPVGWVERSDWARIVTALPAAEDNSLFAVLCSGAPATISALILRSAPRAGAMCGSTAVTGRVSKDARHTRRFHTRTGAEPAFSALLWRRPSVSPILRDASRVAAVHSAKVRAGPLLRMRAETVADALLRDSSCTSLTLRRLFYVISAKRNSCPVSQRNPSWAERPATPPMGFAALNPILRRRQCFNRRRTAWANAGVIRASSRGAGATFAPSLPTLRSNQRRLRRSRTTTSTRLIS
jgi:hypothetical protein